MSKSSLNWITTSPSVLTKIWSFTIIWIYSSYGEQRVFLLFCPSIPNDPTIYTSKRIQTDVHMNNNVVTYGDILLQSALRENTVEFWSQLPFRQDSKHHTLQHHGLRPLKTHNSIKLSLTFKVWETLPASAAKWKENRMRNETKSLFWSLCLKTWKLEWGKEAILFSPIQTVNL